MCVRTCARVHVYFSVHVFVSSIMTLAGRFSTLHPLYTRANCKYVSQFVFQGMSDAALSSHHTRSVRALQRATWESVWFVERFL